MGKSSMVQPTTVGRNDACSCGSGKKFKKCCEAKQRSRSGVLVMVLVGMVALAGLVAAFTQFTGETTHVPKASGVWSAEHGHYH